MRIKTLRLFVALFLFSAITGTYLPNVFAENKKVIINMCPKEFSAPQKVIENTVYAPLRSVMEALGWKLSWNPKSKTISCTSEQRVLVITAGSTDISLDGEKIILEKPVVVSGGVTYIPSIFIAQEFGTQIRWNNKDNLIILSDYNPDNISLEGQGNIVAAGSGIIVNIFVPCSTDTVRDIVGYADRLLAKNKACDAIDSYNDILDNICIDDNPELYLHVLVNIGNAYSLLAEIKDAQKNTVRAIDLYEKALQLYKKENASYSYVCVLNNLGNACRMLFEHTGEKKYADRAIKIYGETLNYFTISESLLDKALIHYSLSLLYQGLGMKYTSHNNLLEAESLFRTALEHYSIDSNPSSYALIQYNLGNIFRKLSENEESGINLERSRSYYEEALKVWNVESYPVNYARVHKCLGDIYSAMYHKDGNKKNADLALKDYTESLKLFTLKAYPVDYAKVNTAIGDLYLSEGSEKSIPAYREALNVFMLSDYPLYNKYITGKMMQFYQ